MKIWKFLILLLFSFLIQSSEIKELLINEEKNVIQFQNENFTQQIKELLEGQTKSIFHIGDSHIQIASFSDGILNTLKENHIDTQNEWTLPTGIFEHLFNPEYFVKKQSHPFECEDARNTIEKTNLGLTGRCFLLKTQENKIVFKSRERFSSLEFLHDKTADFVIESKNAQITKQVISEHYAITTVCFEKNSRKVKLKFKNLSANPCRFYAIRKNYDTTKTSYSNFGISGAKFSAFFNASQFYEQLETLKPNFLIITLGTNDAYFKNLDTIQFQKDLHVFYLLLSIKSPNTSLILTNVPDSKYDGRNPTHITFINSFLENFCRENQIAFWNWFEVMGGENSMELWTKASLASGDNLHFSRKGYLVLGEHFGKALLGLKN